MIQAGQWFDGTVATSQTVVVSARPSGLEIVAADGRAWAVATDQLVRMSNAQGRVRIGHRRIEGWRLDLDQPIDAAVREQLPKRGFTGATNAGRKAMAAAITITAVATLGLGLLVFAPQTIAKHMPMAWEKRIGRLYDLPVGAVVCADPAANQALNALVDRIDPMARRQGLTIQLLDVDDVNAAALPGKRMIVFNGLFDEIKNPDALAGIIAHEIGHVRRRHVATAMVRELGLGTVVTLLGGGAVASSGSGLLSLNFTRGAEGEADAESIDMLRRARIDPRQTEQAFDRFRALEMQMPAWASSHPPNAARGARFAASFDPRISYRPALDPAAAKALFSGCRNKVVSKAKP